MKKLLLVIIVVFAMLKISIAQNNSALSYEQAIVKMSKNNYALKSTHANKKSQEYSRKSTRGLYFPKLSLSASLVKLDQDVGIDISPLSNALGSAINLPPEKMLPSTLVFQKEKFSMVGVNLLWPVFNGGKIRAANKAMDAKIDDALFSIEQTENELNTELVQRYFGYRLSQKAISLYRESYDAMLLHQHNAKRMLENGIISNSEKLYVDISVSNAKMEWQSSVKQANTILNGLNNTLGDTANVVATTPLFLIKQIKPVSFFQESAIRNNAMLKQVGAKKILAAQNYNIKKSDYYPSVAIVANKEVYHDNLSELVPDWFVGVNLRWTIFDGAARTNKVKAAKETVNMVNYLEMKAKADINTYINKLYNQLVMNVEQFETMEVTYEFATEYLRIQNKSFSEGFATAKDVVDAQLILSKVKIARIKTMNDYVLSLAKLLEASGQPELFLQYSNAEYRETENFK